MKKHIIAITRIIYKDFLRNIIFLFDSELVHEKAVLMGEYLGKSEFLKAIIRNIYYVKNENLKQTIAGIDFENPVGLAAGFDYKAKLTGILPALSFGFGTFGTITNNPYSGNPKPRLGRLVNSKSLMVYKGFKNDGIKKVSAKLRRKKFDYPVGLSLGKTNSKNDKMTQVQAVLDVVSAFKIAEKSNLKISYYELNISCPNLFGNVSFYPPQNLQKLLKAVFSLKLTKPVFIKMPISKTDEEVIRMLEVIVKFPVSGVIFGNTQNNRQDKAFVKEELKKYPVGNFSGKPTEKRSNELIKMAYKKYGKRLIIIGCGGIFSGKDAYKKIKLGASLVQLITGLVFEGPQLVAQINLELLDLVKKDKFTNISQAVGIEAK